MEKYLVIARSDTGEEMATAEVQISPEDNLLEMAQAFKAAVDTVQRLFCEPVSECCEVWARESPSSMSLLATVY